MIKRTVSLTQRQIDWLEDRAGIRQIDLPDELRRVLDQLIDGDDSDDKSTAKQEKPADQPAPPVVIERMEPDGSGATIIRIWRSTHALLTAFCETYRVTQAQTIHQLVSAPDALKLRLMLGEYDEPINNETKPRRAIEDIDPDSVHLDIEQFLYDYCAVYPSCHTSVDAVYDSYKYFCNEGGQTPVELGKFRSYLVDRGFMPGGAGNSIYRGLGLRPKALAVVTGAAQGIRLDDGSDDE